MAWIEKRENRKGQRTWYLRYWKPDGSKGSKVLGTGLTKREAQQLMLDFERKQALVASGLVPAESIDCPLKEFLKKHKVYSEANKAASTAHRDDDALRHLLEFVGDVQLSEISRRTIDEFVAHRLNSVRPGTVNVEIRHIKAALNQAIRWEIISRNPVKGVKLIRIPQSDIPKYLEKEQIGALLEYMKDDPLLPLVKFYLFTGARLREGIYLQGEDVDLDRKMIYFRGRWTKNKRNRSLPFGQLPELEQLLRAQNPQTDRPVFPSSTNPSEMWCVDWVSRQISRNFTRIGIPGRLAIPYDTHLLRTLSCRE